MKSRRIVGNNSLNLKMWEALKKDPKILILLTSAMVISPCVQTGQVPHPATHVVQHRDTLVWVYHLVTQGRGMLQANLVRYFKLKVLLVLSPSLETVSEVSSAAPYRPPMMTKLLSWLTLQTLESSLPAVRLRGSVTQPPCWTLHCTQLLCAVCILLRTAFFQTEHG